MLFQINHYYYTQKLIKSEIDFEKGEKLMESLEKYSQKLETLISRNNLKETLQKKEFT